MINSQVLRDTRSQIGVNERLAWNAYLERPETQKLIGDYLASISKKKQQQTSWLDYALSQFTAPVQVQMMAKIGLLIALLLFVKFIPK